MTQIIYGRHPVVAALRQPDNPLEEVIVAQGAGGHWLPEVKRLARAAGVRLRIAGTGRPGPPLRNPQPPGDMPPAGAAMFTGAWANCWTIWPDSPGRPSWWPRTASPTP